VSTDTRALLVLNIAALFMLVLSGWLMLWVTAIIRPDVTLSGSFGAVEVLLGAAMILAALVFMLVLHEAIHGLFFWVYTRARPRFGFKGAYAYAAAPDWYIPRNQYIIVGIAPLILMTLGGIALLPVVPEWLLLPLVIIVVMNASGAVGDIAVVGWLLFLPQHTLIRDLGDAMTMYCLQPDASHE
jgi:hypothetical protein